MENIQNQQNNDLLNDSQTTPTKSKRRLIITLSIIGAIVIFAVIILVMTVFSGKNIDLADYYGISITGLDGYAVATIESNPTSSEAYSKDFKDYSSILQASMFFDTITFELSKEENLSNGDTIQAKAIYDKDQAKQLGIKLNDTITITVSDLEKGIEVDLFASLEIEFTGTSPYGSVTVSNNSTDEDIKTITYSVDNDSDLSNGDTVTVTATIPDDSKIIPKDNTKTYTVEGLSEYITSDLTEEQKTELNTQLQDYLDSYVASSADFLMYESFKSDSDPYLNYDATYTHSVPVLVSHTVLTSKEGSSNGINNKVISIYEMTITGTSNNGSSVSATGYFVITSENVVIDKDGKITFDDATGNSLYYNNSYDALYEKAVTQEKSEYSASDID